MNLVSTIVIILASLVLFIRDEFYADRRTTINRRVSRLSYALMAMSCVALLYNWYSDHTQAEQLKNEVSGTRIAVTEGFRNADERLSNLSSNLVAETPLTFEFYVNGTAITPVTSNVIHATTGDRWIETAVVMLPNVEERKSIVLTARNLGPDQAKDASLIARVPKSTEFEFTSAWRPIEFTTRTDRGIETDHTMDSATFLVGSPVHPSGYIGGAPIHFNSTTSAVVTTHVYVEAMASGAEKRRLNLFLVYNPEATSVTQQ